jgi:hypothetical protein
MKDPVPQRLGRGKIDGIIRDAPHRSFEQRVGKPAPPAYLKKSLLEADERRLEGFKN